MADIAERMEADANYVSQSPGDRSTDTPTDIASGTVHRSIRLAPIVAQSSKDDQCSGRLMLLLLSRAKATDTPTDTTLDLALIDRLDGRCERTEKPKIPRTSSRVGRPDRPGAGIAAGAFAAGPPIGWSTDRYSGRYTSGAASLQNEHEARARTWGFTPRGASGRTIAARWWRNCRSTADRYTDRYSHRGVARATWRSLHCRVD